jgi:hypothetical protein
MAAAQAYDTTYLLTYALFGIRNGQFSGPAVKAALENIPRTYYGVVATYDARSAWKTRTPSPPNMLVMGKVEQRFGDLRLPRRRQAQPVRAAQALTPGRCRRVSATPAPCPHTASAAPAQAPQAGRRR